MMRDPKKVGPARPELRNCRRCGKLFLYVGHPVCPDCLNEQEKQYEVVRSYLARNPRASVREVSEATGVPIDVVIEFLHAGFLVPVSRTGNGNGTSTCAICGCRIAAGRICRECEKTLAGVSGNKDDAGATIKLEPQPKVGNEKMYTADFIRKTGRQH